MRCEGGFQWPMPEFIHQCSRKSACFEVSLFQSDQVEFLIPEALYLWRQVSLEAAIRQNFGNPEGIEVYMFMAADRSDDFAEDAALVRHPAKIISVSGIVVSHDRSGNPHVHFESSGQQTNERNFEQCGYNSVQVKWEDDSVGNSCIWELNVASMPVGDVPAPSGIKEPAQIRLLEMLTALINDKEDPRIRNFFLFPVDTRRYSDYDMMIEVPMDLSLIRKRLENSYYSNLRSFMNDIKLIKENCCKYNDERAEITQVANQLFLSFEDEVREIEASLPGNNVDPEETQKILRDKTNALQLPTYEAREGTVERRATRSGVETSNTSLPPRRPTRGRISGSLDNLATMVGTSGNGATRNLRGGRVIGNSVNLHTPSTSPSLPEGPVDRQTRSKRKQSVRVSDKDKPPDPKSSQEKEPQSKRLRRNLPISYNKTSIEDSEDDSSEPLNSDLEEESNFSPHPTTRGNSQRKCVIRARATRGEQLTSRMTIELSNDSNLHSYEKIPNHNVKRNSSLNIGVKTRASNAVCPSSPSLRKRTVQNYFVPSSNDELVQEQSSSEPFHSEPEDMNDDTSRPALNGCNSKNSPTRSVSQARTTQREQLPRRMKKELINKTNRHGSDILPRQNPKNNSSSVVGVKTRGSNAVCHSSSSLRTRKVQSYTEPSSGDDLVPESEYELSTCSRHSLSASEDKSAHRNKRTKITSEASGGDRAKLRTQRRKTTTVFHNLSESDDSFESEGTSDAEEHPIKKRSDKKAYPELKSAHRDRKVTNRRKRSTIAPDENEDMDYSSSSSECLSIPEKSAQNRSHQSELPSVCL